MRGLSIFMWLMRPIHWYRFYQASFPTVFKPMSEFPEDLRSHIRYPEDFFDVQAYMYRSYHMNDVTVFYNKEDMWSLPTELVQW